MKASLTNLQPLSSHSGHDENLAAGHLAFVEAYAVGGLFKREARANLRPALVLQEPLHRARRRELFERARRAHPVREPEAAHALALEDERARVDEAPFHREPAVDHALRVGGHRAQHAARQLARNGIESDRRAHALASFREPLVEILFAAVEHFARAPRL